MRKQSDIENGRYAQDNGPELVTKVNIWETERERSRPGRHHNQIQFMQLDWVLNWLFTLGALLLMLVFFSCLLVPCHSQMRDKAGVCRWWGCGSCINIGLFFHQASALSWSMNESFVSGCGGLPTGWPRMWVGERLGTALLAAPSFFYKYQNRTSSVKVTLTGQKGLCRCEWVKNLETGRLSWIIRVGPG